LSIKQQLEIGRQNGQIMVLVLALIGIGLLITGAMLSLMSGNYFFASQNLKTNQALTLAEAGIDQTIKQINANPNYTGTSAPVSLNTGQFEVTVIALADPNKKEVTATAYVPTKTNPIATKTVRVMVAATPNEESVSFHYAIQSGSMGITVGGNSNVKGNLFSNANIDVNSSSAKVEGDAFAVGTISQQKPGQITGQIQEHVQSQPLPVVNIDFWKNEAKKGGTHQGDLTNPGSVSLGPLEITGRFQLSQECTINITGPIWIHGDINLSGKGTFTVDPKFGANGTIIIADGHINISGQYTFNRTAQGGYLLFLSTSPDVPAISYSGTASGSGAYYAYNGGMTISGSGKLAAITGKGLNLSGNGDIIYEEGLASAIFSSGPGGTYTIMPGTWREIP